MIIWPRWAIKTAFMYHFNHPVTMEKIQNLDNGGKMKRTNRWAGILTVLLMCMTAIAFAGDQEIAGVTFPGEKQIAGTTLKLNGVALRKALMVIKVYAGGLYLETPTHDARKVIESEQVKHLHLHYLTGKATAKKLQAGFIEAMEAANPPEQVEKHRQEIDRFASWLDTDMKPGSITESTYIPGKGLTLWVAGKKKGTVHDREFIQMYYRYCVGKKADKRLRKGYLGLN